MISLDAITAYDVIHAVADRVRKRRRERKFTQAEMAKRAGMSLASYKRFEQTGEISFRSLANIAIALDCEADFDELFSRRQYSSIEEIINSNQA